MRSREGKQFSQSSRLGAGRRSPDPLRPFYHCEICFPHTHLPILIPYRIMKLLSLQKHKCVQ